MDLVTSMLEHVTGYLSEHYDLVLRPEEYIVNPTRKEFEGDYTLVVYPLAGRVRKNPQEIGLELGDYLAGNSELVDKYELVKGFLNITFTDSAWLAVLSDLAGDKLYPGKGQKGLQYVLEFSSPNTNKPLHLGHIRNILLGWSVGRIMEAAGYSVHKTQIINDRGIAICKSMVAWQKYAQGENPDEENRKGDHFVGDYYVKFEQAFQEEYRQWQESAEANRLFQAQSDYKERNTFFSAFKNEYFNRFSELGAEARKTLVQWEAGDPSTMSLWKQMNEWVYEGFEETYRKLGVEFDSSNYESETYLLGKEIIEEGLEKGVFYKKEDGSVWVDLTGEGLDHKLLLRSDGTAVYMTQDIGTARLRYEKHHMDGMIYTVADEQNYHFQALFAILRKLGEPYASGLHHLSYGMVDLPGGKMKSREGTVVDADDLIEEVVDEARANAEQRGELAPLPPEEQEDIIRKIGMSALKYHILKVDPQKRMTFDPEESVDLQGQTGPYIQNAYVRIRSVHRKANKQPDPGRIQEHALAPMERELLRTLAAFPAEVQAAARQYNPALVANYAYGLARNFHKFYHDHPILRAETSSGVAFRLELSRQVGRILEAALDLLGIEMPERM